MPSQEAKEIINAVLAKPELVSRVDWEKLFNENPDLPKNRIIRDLGIPEPEKEPLPPEDYPIKRIYERPLTETQRAGQIINPDIVTSPLMPVPMAQAANVPELIAQPADFMSAKEQIDWSAANPPWGKPKLLFGGREPTWYNPPLPSQRAVESASSGIAEAAFLNYPDIQSRFGDIRAAKEAGEFAGMLLPLEGMGSSVRAVPYIAKMMKKITPFVMYPVTGAITGATYGGTRKLGWGEDRLGAVVTDAVQFGALSMLPAFKDYPRFNLDKKLQNLKTSYSDFVKDILDESMLEPSITVPAARFYPPQMMEELKGLLEIPHKEIPSLFKRLYGNDLKKSELSLLARDFMRNVNETTWGAMDLKGRAQVLGLEYPFGALREEFGPAMKERTTISPTSIAGAEGLRADLAAQEAFRLKKSAPREGFTEGPQLEVPTVAQPDLTLEMPQRTGGTLATGGLPIGEPQAGGLVRSEGGIYMTTRAAEQAADMLRSTRAIVMQREELASEAAKQTFRTMRGEAVQALYDLSKKEGFTLQGVTGVAKQALQPEYWKNVTKYGAALIGEGYKSTADFTKEITRFARRYGPEFEQFVNDNILDIFMASSKTFDEFKWQRIYKIPEKSKEKFLQRWEIDNDNPVIIRDKSNGEIANKWSYDPYNGQVYVVPTRGGRLHADVTPTATFDRNIRIIYDPITNTVATRTSVPKEIQWKDFSLSNPDHEARSFDMQYQYIQKLRDWGFKGDWIPGFRGAEYLDAEVIRYFRPIKGEPNDYVAMITGWKGELKDPYGALAKFDSKEMVRFFKNIERFKPSNVRIQLRNPVLGRWEGTHEPSYELHLDGPEDAVKGYLALLSREGAKMGEQDGVVGYRNRRPREGERSNRLYEFKFDGPLTKNRANQINRTLKKLDISGSSYKFRLGEKDQDRLVIIDLDNNLATKIASLERELGIDAGHTNVADGFIINKSEYGRYIKKLETYFEDINYARTIRGRKEAVSNRGVGGNAPFREEFQGVRGIAEAAREGKPIPAAAPAAPSGVGPSRISGRLPQTQPTPLAPRLQGSELDDIAKIESESLADILAGLRKNEPSPENYRKIATLIQEIQRRHAGQAGHIPSLNSIMDVAKRASDADPMGPLIARMQRDPVAAEFLSAIFDATTKTRQYLGKANIEMKKVPHTADNRTFKADYEAGREQKNESLKKLAVAWKNISKMFANESKRMDIKVTYGQRDPVTGKVRTITRYFAERENYFPHMLSDEMRNAAILQKGPLWEAVIRELKNKGKYYEGIEKDIRNFATGGFATRELGNIEKPRMFDDFPETVMVDGKPVDVLELDPYKAISKYTERAARRLGVISKFGQDSKLAQDLYKKAGTTEAQGMIEELWQRMNLTHQSDVANREFAASTGGKVISTVDAITRGVKLSLAPISNIFGPAQSFEKFRFRDTIAAMKDPFLAKLGDVGAKERMRILEENHGFEKDVFGGMTMMEELHGKMSNVVHAEFKYNLMNALNRYTNEVSSGAAVRYINHAIEVMREGKTGFFKKLTGSDPATYNRALQKDFGFTEVEVQGMIRNGMTDLQKARIVQRAPALTNAWNESVADIPAWMRGPLGKRIFAYTSFQRVMFNITKRAMGEATHGNVVPLLKILGFQVVTGELIRTTRDWIYNRKRTDRNIIERLWLDILESATLGVYGSFISGFKYGTSLKEQLMPPTVEYASDLIDALRKSIKERSPLPLAKEAVRGFPGVKAAANVAYRIAEPVQAKRVRELKFQRESRKDYQPDIVRAIVRRDREEFRRLIKEARENGVKLDRDAIRQAIRQEFKSKRQERKLWNAIGTVPEK